MPLLNQVALLLLAAVLAVPLFKRLRLGSVLGYLAAGLLIGPFGLRLITDVQSILHFSEFGVVLLLFLMGLELNPSRLWVMRRAVFGLGGTQVVATGAALAGMAYLLGAPPLGALVTGVGLALSSTAFVLPLLAEKQQLSTPHGNASFAILLFQDLAVIPLLVVLPLLGGAAPGGGAGLAELALKVLLALGGLVVAGRYLVRPVFRVMASTGSQEILTAAALLLVLGTALAMEHAGLSMTLGTFLAGVLLAESEYRHELQADIEPFKGLLLGLFFMAVGMSANLGLLREAPLTVLGVVLGFMAVKAALLYLVSRVAGQGSETARHVACALPQGGEFAFVLFGIAAKAGLMAPRLADLLVVAVTLSMVLTPLAVAFDEKVLARWRARGDRRPFDAIDEEDNPVVIAGFGRFGQIVARVLRSRRIRFTALEASTEQIDFLRRFGNKIYYGDATRLDLLRAAGVERAKVFVLAVDDMVASVRIAELVRHHFPQVKILARARNRQHAYQLMALGIDPVVRETFHASLEMARHALEALSFSTEEARHTVDTFARYDQAMVEAQYVNRHDEAKLVQTAKQAALELESLFNADSAR